MTVTLTADRPALSPAKRAVLDQLRARLKAAGWSAQVVTLPPDERAERINDYALEG